MDSGEANRCENQGHASDIIDHKFIDLPRHHTHRGEATWTPNQVTSTAQRKSYSYRELSHNLKPTSDDFKPSQPFHILSFPMYNTSPSNAVAETDLGKYLMRRELVSSGLMKFEDKPEDYWAWKASFISSTDDLKLSAREELDLLCKWLGLLRKVEDFPKISAKENHKLRELGDILMELEAARADGYLPGLSYRNTSRGVSPIVQKLPSNLQERLDGGGLL